MGNWWDICSYFLLFIISQSLAITMFPEHRRLCYLCPVWLLYQGLCLICTSQYQWSWQSRSARGIYSLPVRVPGPPAASLNTVVVISGSSGGAGMWEVIQLGDWRGDTPLIQLSSTLNTPGRTLWKYALTTGPKLDNEGFFAFMNNILCRVVSGLLIFSLLIQVYSIKY